MNFWEQIPNKTKIFFLIFIGLVYVFILLIYFRARTQTYENPVNSWMQKIRHSRAGIIPTPDADALIILGEDSITIYRSPGEGFEIVGNLEAGQEAQVIGVSEDGLWLAIKVIINEDNIGWLRASEVQSPSIADIPMIDISGNLIVDATPTPIFSMVTAVMETRIFSGPGDSYEEIAILEVGQKAHVIGISQNNEWWVIEMPYIDNGRGYVSAEEVIADNTISVPVEEIPTVTSISNVNIRSGPGIEYEKIGLLKEGKTIMVIGKDYEEYWWAVQVPDSQEIGWISVDYVTGTNLGNVPVIDPEMKENMIVIPTPSAGRPALSATADINIRKGPGKNYGVINRLKYGQTAEVIGVSSNGDWWAIRIQDSNNNYGWVFSDFVKVKNVENIPILE